MTGISEVLKRIVSILAEFEVPWALVGGLAVSVRADPRFTRDVDIAVQVRTDDEAERLIRALIARGYRMRALVEQEDLDRISTVRFTPHASPIYVDLLFVSSGIEAEVIAGATVVEVLDGIRAPVASANHLFALKLLSVSEERPKDAQDLRALRPLCDADAVRSLVGVIEGRGFHRGHDLRERCERHLSL